MENKTTEERDIVELLDGVRCEGVDRLCWRAAGEINMLRTIVGRLRYAFLEDCREIGYSEQEAQEMLAEVESGSA